MSISGQSIWRVWANSVRPYAFSFLLTLTVVGQLQAQPDTLWTRLYECGPGRDWLRRVIRTYDGGYVLFGQYGMTDSTGGEDFFLIKLDPEGEAEWSRQYHWGRHNQPKSVVQTSDHGYVMVGGVAGGGITSSDWCVKVDSIGEVVWENDYGENSLLLYDVIESHDGNLVMVGFVSGDGYVAKVNANGDLLWDNYFGGGSFDDFQRLIKTSDEGYLLIGEADSFGNSRQGYLVKIDSLGQEEWSRNYGSELIDYFNVAVELQNGDFVIGGGRDGRTAWVLKIDSQGEEIWSRTYYESQGHGVSDLIQSPDGGFLLVGTDREEIREHEYGAYKIDADGNLLWQLDVGETSRGSFSSAVLTDDGGYFIAGAQYPYQLELGRFIEFWVVCTAPDTAYNGVVLLDPAFPSLIALEAPYPNPFNSSTSIRFSTGLETGSARLAVYGVDGKLVQELEKGKWKRENGNVRSATWDACGVGAGVYMVRLEGAGKAEAKKVVLVR